jgi:hypothetical protein
MSKKIMLLSLAAVSAAMFALPATASALTSLHLNPTPAGVQTIDDTGPDPRLSTVGGTTVICDSFHGWAEFDEGGTTGVMQLTFGPNCRTGFVSCTGHPHPTGNITTTELPFHLATLASGDPGVLVTPGANNHFASFTCFGVNTVVTGNGVLGEIEFPECGEVSNKADIDFNATAHGVQQHTKLAGTATEYGLKKGAENAAQDATGTLTLTKEAELNCT